MKLNISQSMRPFYPFAVEENLVNDFDLKDLQSYIKYYSLVPVFTSLISLFIEQTLFNYIVVIFFITICILIFIRIGPDEINVTRSKILFRKKLLFLEFKQSIMKEDIQIIKYAIIKDWRKLHSGHLLIICHNGRRKKFIYISRDFENELIEDLQLIVDKFKKALSIK